MATTSNDGKNHSRRRCCFTGCGRTKQRYPNLRFFSFPVKKPDVCDIWVRNCANEKLEEVPRKTLKEKVVCEKHFDESSYQSKLRTRLSACAVPTIHVGCDDPTPASSTPGNNQDQTPHSSRQIPDADDRQPSVNDPCFRRTLFATPSTSQDPCTPQYKRFKSTKGRKSTPKTNLTPGKKRLITELNCARQLKRRYQQQLQRLRCKPASPISKQMVMTAVQDLLPPKVSNFVCMQLKHADKKKLPWTEDEKQQALAMRYKSPALYEQMRSDGFALPSSSTIARWLQVVDLRPGVCPEIMKMLENKVTHMAEWEKNAVIIFDEMSVKSSLEYDSKRDVIEGLLDIGDDGRKPYPATHVLLFMIRGITYRWKMPVAYFATNKMVDGLAISKILSNVVHACQAAGIQVRAVVCDQGSVNRKAAKLLSTTSTQPYFYVNNKKIFFIYDFPHVIKCLRNNLMKRKNGCFVGQIRYNKSTSVTQGTGSDDEETASGVADWTHVQMLYDIDSRSTKSRATKLTEKHLKPNSFEKMSVKLATQVFSLSVSAAMRTAVETGELPVAALDTAHFLERINNIFDIMNSKSKFNPNPHKCAISSSTNEHLRTPLDTLTREIEWVKTFKMAHDKKRPPCMDGIEQTLIATMLLWEDMSADGAKYLMTNRVNQDPIENEFSISRQKCGFERNPSVRMFRQNLRHRMQAALVQPPAGANCEPDEDELLTTVTPETGSQNKSASCSAATTSTPPEKGHDSFASDTEDEDEEDGELTSPLHCLETCSVRYFTGYGVQSCLKKFKCEDCRKELLKQPDVCSSENLDEALIRNREYKDETCLLYPSEETSLVIDTVLTTLDEVLKKNYMLFGLGSK